MFIWYVLIALMMETAGTSEKSVFFYKTTGLSGMLIEVSVVFLSLSELIPRPLSVSPKSHQFFTSFDAT
jgi:hypothetical protein